MLLCKTRKSGSKGDRTPLFERLTSELLLAGVLSLLSPGVGPQSTYRAKRDRVGPYSRFYTDSVEKYKFVEWRAVGTKRPKPSHKLG